MLPDGYVERNFKRFYSVKKPIYYSSIILPWRKRQYIFEHNPLKKQNHLNNPNAVQPIHVHSRKHQKQFTSCRDYTYLALCTEICFFLLCQVKISEIEINCVTKWFKNNLIN